MVLPTPALPARLALLRATLALVSTESGKSNIFSVGHTASRSRSLLLLYNPGSVNLSGISYS